MAFDQDLAYRGLVQVWDSDRVNSGTGVLAVGGCILTVAHISHPKVPSPLDYRARSMELGVGVPGRTDKIPLLVAHMDTCLDSAILGAAGAHTNLCEDEIENFDALKSELTPQPIQLVDLNAMEPFPVWICSETDGWSQGLASIDRVYPHYLLINADASVRKGMSGGPVFTDDGNVIGCIIGSSDRSEKLAFANLFSACLPGWALRAYKLKAEWLKHYSPTFLRTDLNKLDRWTF